MIKRLEISGVQYEVSDELKKYITKKIGKLDSYMPKSSRSSAHAQVILRESKRKNKKQCTCEVILHLPNDEITVHESTINMFAAVDIVEQKLKNQLKKHKEKYSPRRARRLAQRVVGRFRV